MEEKADVREGREETNQAIGAVDHQYCWKQSYFN